MSPRRAPVPNAEQQPATSIESHVHAVVTILRALSGEAPVPQLELEEQLGVSGRTLRRYIAALKTSGFDIQTRRGQGYQLRFVPESWQGFLPASVVAELATLRVMQNALPVPQSRAQEPLAQLVDTLLRGASGDLAKVEDRLSRAIALREEVPRKNDLAAKHLALCLQAIVQLHPLAVTYSDHKGEVTRRVIEPLGCLFTTGTWYCLAHDRLRKARRNFALERMTEVEILHGELYKYPDQFSIDREYAGAWGIWKRGVPEPVEFLVDRELAQFFAECQFPFPNTKRRKKDGRLQVRTSSADLTATARWLAPYADQVTILQPEELRSEMARRAAAAASRHGGALPLKAS